jgi:signal transduction histidine kinase/CheY-like chemotaxis protein
MELKDCHKTEHLINNIYENVAIQKMQKDFCIYNTNQDNSLPVSMPPGSGLSSKTRYGTTEGRDATGMMRVDACIETHQNSNRITHRISNSSSKKEKKAENIDFNIYLKCFIHELRTPISTISLGLNLLENNCKKAENINTIRDLNKSISYIENTFSKFTIIRDGKITLNPYEPFSITALMKKIQTLLSYHLKESNVTYEYEINEDVYNYCYGDQYNLEHVLINLLKNAIKYCNNKHKNKISLKVSLVKDDKMSPEPPNSPLPSNFSPSIKSKKILDTSEKDEPKKQTIKITIKDMNDHILPNIKKNLFKSFNSTSGSGLGLYICKNIIELHDGKITHEYMKPCGNKFIITIPLELCDNPSLQEKVQNSCRSSKKESYHLPSIIEHCEKNSLIDNASRGMPDDGTSVGRPKFAEGRSPDANKYNILIVDDSEMSCKIMHKVLQPMSIFDKIHMAFDGKEGLVKVLQNMGHIDLIITDKHMPNIDGLSFTRSLRDIGYNKLIIGLTGVDSAKEKEEFIQCGADYVFTKPMDKHKIECLTRFLESYGVERQSGKRMSIVPLSDNESKEELVWEKIVA